VQYLIRRILGRIFRMDMAWRASYSAFSANARRVPLGARRGHRVGTTPLFGAVWSYVLSKHLLL
jgi:hypothetical protein